MGSVVSSVHKIPECKVLLISARSDIGGGPAHMYALSTGLPVEDVFAALPSDGIYFEKFKSRLGVRHVCEIPRQKFTLHDLFRLKRFCSERGIELIHSHGKGAGVYARLLGVLTGLPVVHTLHGYHDARYGLWAKKIYAAWESLAAFFTRKIICVSESERAHFSRKVYVNEGTIVTIPNGTEIQRSPEKACIPGKIVTVARFDYAKNLLEFVLVAKSLPNYTFHIIGDGEQRYEIERFIESNTIENVILHGASETVISDIADAEVYLSTSRWEGLPMAILEAMSLGIPVVASDVVGNRDAIAVGVTGYLYPLGDSTACAQAIERAKLLVRSQIRRFHREHFSSGQMITRTIDLYKDILQESAAR